MCRALKPQKRRISRKERSFDCALRMINEKCAVFRVERVNRSLGACGCISLVILLEHQQCQLRARRHAFGFSRQAVGLASPGIARSGSVALSEADIHCDEHVQRAVQKDAHQISGVILLFLEEWFRVEPVVLVVFIVETRQFLHTLVPVSGVFVQRDFVRDFRVRVNQLGVVVREWGGEKHLCKGQTLG